MYWPQTGDEGFALLKAALRDYIVADLSAYGLPSVTELLPSGSSSVIDEGHMTDTTETPVVMVTTVGDGQEASVKDNTLARFIVYAIDRGRGLSTIEKVLHRLRKRLNKTDVTREFFSFPPNTVDFTVEHIEASGSTSSVSLPAWKAEGRAVYVFVTIRGMEADW